ncbi:guanylate kinase [bacterium]|nr:guanylate kinase [bacterium]
MPSENTLKLLCFSAPSGAGKTSLVRALIERIPELSFSISATSRPRRGTEQEGVDYYFLSPEDFRQRAAQGLLLEWEEVYPGALYGTLVSEIERLRSLGKIPILDMDVYGALGLKKRFETQVLTVFVMPPSLDVLRQRLQLRGTDSPERIEERLAKAKEELRLSEEFDRIVLNDEFAMALEQAEAIVRRFIEE